MATHALATAAGGCLAVAAAGWLCKGWVYDAFVLHMTGRWYEVALAEVPEGGSVIDVGIGTGAALLLHANELKRRKLRVYGLDYDAAYVRRARRLAAAEGLEGSVQVHCASLYDAAAVRGAVEANGGEAYDVCYFSGSFSLLPDLQEALAVARRLVKPGGKVVITQTFQRPHWTGPIFAAIKPRMQWLTTIDFGPLIYESEVRAVLDAAPGLAVERNATIPGSVDAPWQAARMVVLRPTDGDAPRR